MWAIRILSGSQAGQIFPLHDGKNRLGRSESADCRVIENGVSKEHIEITVSGQKVAFADLNSSNGTFLNGVRTRGGSFKIGDKLSAANVLFDLIPASKNALAVASGSNTSASPRGMTSVRPTPPPSLPQFQELRRQMPMQQQAWPAAPAQQQAPAAPAQPAANFDGRSFSQKFDDYVNKNFLPPFLQATEQFEFRMVLMAVLGVYVVIVTLLSVVPMKQITSDSISTESKRRALTVARALARGNERVLRTGDFTNFSTDFVLKEEGVDDAYVIGKDSHILAPAERVGSMPKEAGFFRDVVLKANGHEVTQEIGGKVISALPILGYDPELQQNVARAYAVVIYNPGTLAYDDGKVFSLFIQTLSIAMVIGGLMYFLLYRMIQYPFTRLNEQIDGALRDNRMHAEVSVQLPVLQQLITNINSLLSRTASAANTGNQEVGKGARNQEYMNLLAIVGYPTILISGDGAILKCNHNFEALLGISAMQIEGRPLNSLPDQALQKNIGELVTSSRAMAQQLASDRLEIAGHQFQLNCQAMTLASGEVDCFFVTIRPAEGAEGNAA